MQWNRMPSTPQALYILKQWWPDLSAGCSNHKKGKILAVLTFFLIQGPERHRQGSPDISHLHDPSPPNSPNAWAPQGPQGPPHRHCTYTGRAHPHASQQVQGGVQVHQSCERRSGWSSGWPSSRWSGLAPGTSSGGQEEDQEDGEQGHPRARPRPAHPTETSARPRQQRGSGLGRGGLHAHAPRPAGRRGSPRAMSSPARRPCRGGDARRGARAGRPLRCAPAWAG